MWMETWGFWSESSHSTILQTTGSLQIQISILQEHCKTHLMEGCVSVFDDVCQLQHFASSLAFNQTTAPTTIWNQQQDMLWFKGIQVKMLNLVGGLQDMLRDLNTKMHNLSGNKASLVT
jgi:hypothetical protein